MSTRRAIVIGGSVGGLFAAHLLRRAGWDAVIYERSAEGLVSRGAGIATHPQLHEIMQRLGIAFDDSMGVRITTLVILDRTGRTIVERPTDRIMSAWARICASLKAALPAACYHFDKSLERVTQDAGGVTAHFADGPFDCLVHLKEDRTLTDQAGRGPRLRVSRPDPRPGGSHCAPLRWARLLGSTCRRGLPQWGSGP